MASRRPCVDRANTNARLRGSMSERGRQGLRHRAKRQGAQFGAGQRMDQGYPALEPRDVQPSMDDIGLLPAEGAQLRHSQSMPEGQHAGRTSRIMVASQKTAWLEDDFGAGLKRIGT